MKKYPLGHLLSTIRTIFLPNQQDSVSFLASSYLSQIPRNGQLRVISIVFLGFRCYGNMHSNTCWWAYRNSSLHPSFFGRASHSELEKDHLGPVKKESFSGMFTCLGPNPNKNISSSSLQDICIKSQNCQIDVCITIYIINAPGQEWLTDHKAQFQSGIFACRVYEHDWLCSFL